MIPWLPQELVFPPLSSALTKADGANGLLAAGGDLSPQRILTAYRRGIFPWFSEGDPILWWSPDPRMVLVPSEIHLSKSLRRTLRNKTYEVRLDTAFDRVIAACSATPRPGQNGTWILPEMQAAYRHLHALGYAHSVETWIDGELVGGLYGLALGRVFFGESMFSHARDVSKIALAHLCLFLQRREFGIIDCQMETEHLASLGARPIPRRVFAEQLAYLTQDESPAPWPADGILNAFKQDHDALLSPNEP